MRYALGMYAAGVGALSSAGFFCPWWELGFIPLGAGLVVAAYDLVNVEAPSGDTQTTPR